MYLQRFALLRICGIALLSLASISLAAQTVAPAYQNFPAPNGLAVSAGEPSIGVNWKTGKVMYQAGLETDRVTFSNTNPATATWENVSSPETSALSLDPILFVDHATGRTVISQLAGACSLSSFTDNDGASYTPAVGCGVPAGIDHQTIGGGPMATSAVSGIPGALGYPNAVYYCSQGIVDASCALSVNGGLSYGPAVPIYTLVDCGGLHGHIKVGPDGSAYVPNKSCGSTQGVIVSRDNGTSWSIHPVPGSTSGDSDPTVAVGSDNTVYFGWHNGNGHPMVAVSHDHGTTWTNITDVGTSLGIQNVAFPSMVAGDGNRAALAFLGTPTAGNAQDTANFTGIWHLYIAHTYDGGATWSLADATPNDPVQRGSICLQGTTCGNDRNLLDFIDTTIDSQGRVLVGYADGCVGACITGLPNSFTALGTIARQSSGKGLLAAFDGTF